jgi:O-antigen/teichoic acid export membrane protein
MKSVTYRFAGTFLLNGIRMAIAMVTGFILAKSLGPEQYGDYNFLMGTFLAIYPLLEMGTSSAFFTFASQQKQSRNFFKFYGFWVLAQFLLQLFVIGLILPKNILDQIWLGHDKSIILIAMTAGFVGNNALALIRHIGESARQNIYVQKLRVFCAVGFLLCIIISWQTGIISLKNTFLFAIICYTAMELYFLLKFDFSKSIDYTAQLSFKKFFWKIYTYSAPLFWSSWALFAYEFADRWMLQKFGGSAEQGYFSLGEQFSKVALIGTVSLSAIFWKEIAQAHHQGDKKKTEQLFLRSTKTLSFFACAISAFLLPFIPEIVEISLGAEYKNAVIPLSIMLFVPVYGASAHINSFYLRATEQTNLVLVFAVCAYILQILMGYFFLAPCSYSIPGLEMGAIGISLKRLLIMVVMTNIPGYIICRKNNWKWPVFSYILSMSILFLLGQACFFITVFADGLKYGFFIRIILGSIIYGSAVMAIIYKYPNLLGFDRNKIISLLKKIKGITF